MKDRLFAVLQQLGKSLMLPIAVLPVAGILLGIGSSFTNLSNLQRLGLLEIIVPGSFIYSIFSLMSDAGSCIFDNLPIIFAIGVGLGLANKDKHTAALSACLAYIVGNMTSGRVLVLRGFVDE